MARRSALALSLLMLATPLVALLPSPAAEPNGWHIELPGESILVDFEPLARLTPAVVYVDDESRLAPPVVAYGAKFEGGWARYTASPTLGVGVLSWRGEYYELRREAGILRAEPATLTDRAIEIDEGALLIPVGQPVQQTDRATNDQTLLLDLIIDGDMQFYNRQGEDWNAKQIAILNAVEGVYEAEHNIVFRVVHQHIHTASAPLASTAAETLLDQLTTYWNARAFIKRDSTHMFTGKDLDGGTIGIARATGIVVQTGGTAGNPSDAYSLAMVENDNFQDNSVTAHEIGHTMSGTHELAVCPVTGDGASIGCDVMFPYYFGPPVSAFHFAPVNEAMVRRWGEPHIGYLKDNDGPTAEFHKSARSGLNVTLDASESRDPDGDWVTFVWDFGDGTQGEGKTVSHVFPYEGSFNVTLVVSDGLEAANASREIVLGNQAPPPPPTGKPPGGSASYNPPNSGDPTEDPTDSADPSQASESTQSGAQSRKGNGGGMVPGPSIAVAFAALGLGFFLRRRE